METVSLRREESELARRATPSTAGMIRETLTLEVRMDASTTGLTEAPPRRYLLTSNSSALSDTVKANFSRELLMESKFGLLTVLPDL